jgi:hypothetical protein
MLTNRACGAGLLLTCTLAVFTAGRAAAEPAAVRAAAIATLETPAVEKAAVRSQLPSAPGADVWVDLVGVDAKGVPTPSIAGQAPGIVRRYAVNVFRPAGDNLKWDDLLSLYMAQGVLAPGAPLLLSSAVNPAVTVVPAGGAMNAKDLRVYKPRAGGDVLVLGLIRNLRTRHQLAFGVLLTGTFDNAQALLYGAGLAESLAEDARKQRMRPPVPQGAVPIAASQRLTTAAQLQQLQTSIIQSPAISERVKQMARAILPGATSITLYAYRTSGPLTDAAFAQFYNREAARLGWGAPVSQDETQPGFPALLFQRSTGDGMMMVRAQPAAGAGGPKPSTAIYILMVEGRFTR